MSDQLTPYQARKHTLKLVERHIGLDPDEEVLLLVRKHWVVFRNALLVTFFIPFVLLFGVFFINEYPLQWSADIIRLITTGLLLLAGAVFVAGGLGFLWRLHMWHHTFYVMTSKKLAIINRFKPWSYEVQQINLNNINDVTLKQEGMEAVMYGFSDIIAITFSGSTFVFEHVGKAPDVQKAIMQQLALQKRPDFLGVNN